MKAKDGKLRLDLKYEYKGLICQEGWYERCDNCDNIIKNICIVECEMGVYHIGTECLKFFINLEPSKEKQIKKEIVKTRKFYRFIMKECKSIYVKKEGIAYAYKREVEGWERGYYYAFNYKKYQDLVEKSGVKVVKE